MRTIMNTTSLVLENVRGTALVYNAFLFLVPYRLRESYSPNVVISIPTYICTRNTSLVQMLLEPQRPKEWLVLFGHVKNSEERPRVFG